MERLCHGRISLTRSSSILFAVSIPCCVAVARGKKTIEVRCSPSMSKDLEPANIAMLRLVQRRLSKFCLDERIWKYHCFKDSAWYKSLLTRRSLLETSHDPPRDSGGSGRSNTQGDVDDGIYFTENNDDHALYSTSKARERRDMANWDPTFPGERISWYDEYVQRNGPACVNWFQTPRIRDGGLETFVEARGMATYNPYNGDSGGAAMLAVSPLDDGSVSLWDVKGTLAKQGSIIARSEPGILFIDGPAGQNTRRSKRIDTGVTECVSVNNNDHKAFFAVQSREWMLRACVGISTNLLVYF